MKKTHVLVIDDHPVITAGIELMIQTEPEFAIVDSVSNSHQAIECVERLLPDLVILDLNLGGNEGINLIKRIHKIRKAARILVFSASDELTFGLRSIKAGASGFLMKSEGLEELLVALKKLQQGDLYLSDKLKNHLLEKNFSNNHGSQGPENEFYSEIDQLTDRELQILQFISKGYATGKIAEILHISPKTISAHKEHIKNKLGVDSSVDLFRMAISFSGKMKI